MHKKLLSYLVAGVVVVSSLFLVSEVSHASVLPGFQGGTGFGSTSTNAVAQCLAVASTSPFLTYRFSPCSNGGTVGPSTSTFVAVFNSSGTVTGYSNLSYISSTNILYFDSGQLGAIVDNLGTVTLGGTILQLQGAGNIRLDSSGNIVMRPLAVQNFEILDGTSGKQAILDTTVINADRTYQFPNASGVFCLTATCGTSNIASGTPWFPTGEVYIDSSGILHASSSFIFMPNGAVSSSQFISASSSLFGVTVINLASTSQEYVGSSTVIGSTTYPNIKGQILATNGNGLVVGTSTPSGGGGSGGVGTSTTGAYNPNNIAFFDNSSTIDATNSLTFNSSTGLFQNFKITSSTETRSASTTLSNISTALVLSANATGGLSAYGGAGACAGGGAVTTISAVGATTCTAFQVGTITTSTVLASGQIDFSSGLSTIANINTFTFVSSTGMFSAPSGTFSGFLSVTGAGLFVSPATTSTALVFFKGNTITSSTFLISGMLGQTADLFDITSSTGQRFLTVLNNGDVTIGSSTDNGAFSVVNASGTAFQVSSTTGNSNALLVNGTTTVQSLNVNSSTVLGVPSFNTCLSIYMAGSSTKFWVTISSSTGGILTGYGEDLVATSTKPAGC